MTMISPNTLPCIDCITLPICLAIYHGQLDRNVPHMVFIHSLCSRCSLIFDYLRDPDIKANTSEAIINIPQVYLDRETSLFKYMREKAGHI
jgi:hypothetical protein